jgi:hypothetical protein
MCSQTCRAPTRNSSVLVASRAEERKGDGGGVLGPFIGVVMEEETAGINRDFNRGGE